MLNCPSCEHYDQANSYCNLFRHAVNLGCQSGTERKPRNHFEMVKAMSVEEMAVVIAWPYIASPPWCAEHITCPYISEDPTPCDKCALEWLKEACGGEEN